MQGLALIIKAWGNAVGENLAPMKDFPHEHQRINKGDDGRRTKVELGMLALPQRHFLCIFFAENQIQRLNDNDSHFYYHVIVRGWLSIPAEPPKALE